MPMYNTGNPVGSTAPKDLYDNAQVLDKLVVGSDPMVLDRLGSQRYSWAGMEYDFQTAQAGREQAFQDFLAASAFVFIGDYAAGLNFTNRSQYMIRDGIAYRVSPGTTLPYVSTGNWGAEAANFTPISSDDILRQDLADPTEGATLVAYDSDSTVAEAISELFVQGESYASAKGPIYYASKNGINVNSASTDQAPAVNALLALMPSGSTLVLDGPVLRTDTTIKIPKDGLSIRGINRSGTTIRSYGSGAIIEALTQATVTTKFFNLSDVLLLRNSTATGSGFLLDLKSMQFCTIERTWILGANVVGQIGIRMEAQATAAHVAAGTATEGSYNYVRDSVIGGVTDCISIRNIANSNTVENVRCQPSVSGGYGIRIVADADAYVNNIRILSSACEYPGNISNGVYVGDRVSGVTILGHRFESLNEGLRVIAGAGEVFAPDSSNYYSSNTTPIANGGDATYRGTGAMARFTGGATPVISRSINVASVVRSAAGVYDVTFSKALGGTYIPLVSSSNPMVAWVSPTTTTLQIRTYNTAGALTDAAFVGLNVEL